jgi:cobalt/nickel transport system permease protein/cobalt/nickel transport protein
VLGTVAVGVAALAIVGLLEGGGDPGRLFGADWSQISWPDVIGMLLFVAVTGAILIPVAYLVLPARWKRVGAAFTALAVIAPLGLIAPGFAYGEGSAEDVQAAFGYIPQGLQDLSGIFSAPLSGYDVPFLQGSEESLLRTAIGYEIAGIIGILLCGVAVLAIVRLIPGRRGRDDVAPAPSEPASAQP